LPDLAIRQSGESLRQHGGDQQGTSEPFHGAVRVHKLSLLFDKFPDVQFLPPSCSVRSELKNRPESRALLPKISFQDRTISPPAPYSVRVRQTTVHTQKQVPLRVKGEAVKYLSSLPQFHGIPDESLIRLAERRTGLNVPDRWVAVALIIGNRVPIPVPTPDGRPQGKPSEATTPAKLVAITGGRIAR